MNEDPLHSLIQHADRPAPSVAPRQIAAGAMVKARRRSQRRRSALAAGIFLLMAGGTMAILIGRGPNLTARRSNEPARIAPSPANSGNGGSGGSTFVDNTSHGSATKPDSATAADRAALAQFEAEADFDAQLASDIRNGRRIQRDRSIESGTNLAINQLGPGMDTAASMLVSEGDRLASDPTQSETAAQFYGAVTRDFPDTRYASIAAQHQLMLPTMKNQKKAE